jgi:hypothetical protein
VATYNCSTMSLQIVIISSKNLYNQQMEEYIVDLLGPFWKLLINTCDQLKSSHMAH